MGPGQSGGEASALGGRTLVSTNDICNIILSGVTRLGLDSLLKCGRGIRRRDLWEMVKKKKQSG